MSIRAERSFRKIHLLWQVPLAGLCVWFVVSLLLCLGIVQLPMPMPHRSLEQHLVDDFGCTLPDDAVVKRGTYGGGRDPSAFYLVELSAHDRASIIQQVRSAAAARGHVVEAGPAAPPWTSGRAPSWWLPQSLENGMRLEVMVEPPGKPAHWYWWFYSLASDELFVAWFDT